jgi:hypothetical protein
MEEDFKELNAAVENLKQAIIKAVRQNWPWLIWYRFGWPRAWAEFSSWARSKPQGSRVRRWVARREGWGYDDQLMPR